MDWRQWLYVVFTTFMGISLYGFLWYLYGSVARGQRIERRGELIFHEEPFEGREPPRSAT